MSRVAKAIVTIPAGVDVSINAETIKVKGKGGDLSLALNGLVAIGNNDGKLSLPPTTPVKLTLWPVLSASWSTTWSRA
jgi:large subunit ribosomal protein L6